MTRKDYVLIAAAIVATQDRIRKEHAIVAGAIEERGMEQLRGVRRAAAHLCDALAKDNPNFKQGRFLKACGYSGTSMNPRDPALDLRPEEPWEENARRCGEGEGNYGAPPA